MRSRSSIGDMEVNSLRLHAAILTIFQLVSVIIILGTVALVSWLLKEPVLVPSLAACAFLQILLPDIPAAKPWAVVVGQIVGLASGTVSIYFLGAEHAPTFAASHPLAITRAVAAVLAAALTLVGQRMLHAGNAAGAALAVTVALGDSSADLSGVVRGVIGILLVATIGEIARRLVLCTR